jgi:hypothetical protein
MTNMPAWTVAEAKAKFSQVIERARTSADHHPQRSPRRCRRLSAEQWERRTSRAGTLVDFLALLRGSGLTIERSKDRPRDIEL